MAGLHFASLPHVQILNGWKTISCKESKHAPSFCWLIYIVYKYRQQNLHFRRQHSNHMFEWTLTKSDNLVSDCYHHTPKRGWPGHLGTNAYGSGYSGRFEFFWTTLTSFCVCIIAAKLSVKLLCCLKGGHSKKRVFFVLTNKKFMLS